MGLRSDFFISNFDEKPASVEYRRGDDPDGEKRQGEEERPESLVREMVEPGLVDRAIERAALAAVARDLPGDQQNGGQSREDEERDRVRPEPEKGLRPGPPAAHVHDPETEGQHDRGE